MLGCSAIHPILRICVRFFLQRNQQSATADLLLRADAVPNNGLEAGHARVVAWDVDVGCAS